jgi:flagellar motor switch protein FliM
MGNFYETCSYDTIQRNEDISILQLLTPELGNWNLDMNFCIPKCYLQHSENYMSPFVGSGENQ